MTTQSKHTDKIKSFFPWTDVKEIPVSILAVTWFVSCVFLATLADVYLDRVNPFVHVPLGQRIRVEDPILKALYPIYLKLGFAWNFPDTLCRFSPLLMILRILLGGNQTLLILRRVGYLVGLGFLIRTPFVMMTMLPNPYLECTIDPNPNLFLYAIEVLSQKKATCGDVAFSGHTVLFMSASLVWVENPVPWFSRYFSLIVNFLVILYSAFGVTIMVASTFHYTIDCVLSVLTMLFIWKFYHFVVGTHLFDGTFIGKTIKWADGTQFVNNSRKPIISPSEPFQEISSIA